MIFLKLTRGPTASTALPILVVVSWTFLCSSHSQQIWAQAKAVADVQDASLKAKFAPPFPIPARDGPLDIEKRGGASPALFDFDNDGIRDLLVGEEFNGSLRIYTNEGSDKRPAFSDFDLFMNGSSEGRLQTFAAFRPRIADLDRDGLSDLLSPDGSSIAWFRRQADGSFAGASSIRNKAGQPIAMERIWGVADCDWNNDGVIDLIVGSQGQWIAGGNIFLLLNSGETSEGFPQFENPVPVLSREQPIQIPTTGPMPEVADWNSDGLFDIIVKTYEGGVGWLPNIGTHDEPQFENYLEILKQRDWKGAGGGISVEDFNLDGKLDLIIGANGTFFQKNLSPRERKALQRFQETEDATLKRWGRTFRLYRGLAKSGETTLSTAAVKTNIRNQLSRLNQELKSLRSRKEYFTEGQQIHSHVWVYLRK